MAKQKPAKSNSTKDRPNESVQSKTAWLRQLWDWFRQPEVWGVLALSTLAFCIILYFYPFPATMSDTGEYVLRAERKITGVFRPFGYSWFILKLHEISGTVRSLVIAQFLLHVSSVIYFLRAVLHFFPAQSSRYKWALIVLLDRKSVV